jgi:acyl carrier protein
MEASAGTVSPEEIMALITELLVEEFDVEAGQVTEAATMEELELDSLDMVEIAQVAEQKYGVRIRASDAEGVVDLGGVVRMIHDKIANPDPAGGGGEAGA